MINQKDEAVLQKRENMIKKVSQLVNRGDQKHRKQKEEHLWASKSRFLIFVHY